LNWARVAWHRTEIWGSISKRQQKNKKAAAFYIETQQLKKDIKRPSLGSQMPFESNFPSFLFVADDDKISQDFFLGLNLQMIKKKEGKKERKKWDSFPLPQIFYCPLTKKSPQMWVVDVEVAIKLWLQSNPKNINFLSGGVAHKVTLHKVRFVENN